MDNCVRKTPKISIITVCYNSEKYLEETIQSVLRQNYQNVEYIIIDGGSTDNTVSIIDKYRQYITYFVSEPDNGISDAFNKGIRVATGDVIGIINSDDLLEEGALERVAQEYAPSVDWYRGDCKVWNDQTGFVFIEHSTLDWPAIPIKMRGAHPSTFVSRNAYRKYGTFGVDLRYAMDTDLFIRFSRHRAVVKYVPQVLACFRLGGVSQSDEIKRTDELKLILRRNGSTSFQIFIWEMIYKFRLSVKHFMMLFGEDARFLLAKKF
jgi:Glycosyltransferases involved in cell wall biogenesis